MLVAGGRGLGGPGGGGGGGASGNPSRNDDQLLKFEISQPPNLWIFRGQHCAPPCTGPSVFSLQRLYLRGGVLRDPGLW